MGILKNWFNGWQDLSYCWENLCCHGILFQWFFFQGCYSMNNEHMSMNKWTQGNILNNILVKSTKYYMTWRMKYLVMWKNILPCVMDDQFFSMKKWMINKMDKLSNEHWQQIKLHIPPFTTNFSNLYSKLHYSTLIA
jgi:hypothetical protein